MRKIEMMGREVESLTEEIHNAIYVGSEHNDVIESSYINDSGRIVVKTKSGSYELVIWEMEPAVAADAPVAPEYTVYPEDDCATDCLPGTGATRYGAEVDRDDVPNDIREVLDAANVQYRDDDGTDASWWTSDIRDDDDVLWTIAFRPTVRAIVDAGDDLSCITWDRPGYYRQD